MKTPRLSLSVALALLASSAAAQSGLLVYEGMNYKPSLFDGVGNVGFGMTGTWFGEIGPKPYHAGQFYRVLSGATPAGNGPYGEHWDGKLTHLVQTGLYAGTTHTGTTGTNRDWGDHTFGDRKLAGQVTGIFAAGLPVWISFATQYTGHQNHYKPMIAIGAGKLSGSRPIWTRSERGKHADGQAIGLGANYNNEAIRASFWHDADQDGLHERFNSATTIGFDRSAPQICIARIEWDVTVGGKKVDRITVARFTDTTPLTLANWNSATKSVIETTVNLDQSKFDTLSFSGSRYYLDEIRIGTTFDSVVSGTYVDNFAADTATVDIQKGGEQRFFLNAGATHANRNYWIFGSLSGTSPGTVLQNINIPLNPDAYTDLAIGLANSPVFANFRGTLDAKGSAEAKLAVPANQPIPKGLKAHHAFVVFDSSTGKIHMASGAVQVEFK